MSAIFEGNLYAQPAMEDQAASQANQEQANPTKSAKRVFMKTAWPA